MNHDIHKQLFRTDNLGLASTLRYFDFKICNVSRTSPNNRHLVVEFEESNELLELVKNYWSEVIAVEPHEYTSV